MPLSENRFLSQIFTLCFSQRSRNFEIVVYLPSIERQQTPLMTRLFDNVIHTIFIKVILNSQFQLPFPEPCVAFIVKRPLTVKFLGEEEKMIAIERLRKNRTGLQIGGSRNAN